MKTLTLSIILCLVFCGSSISKSPRFEFNLVVPTPEGHIDPYYNPHYRPYCNPYYRPYYNPYNSPHNRGPHYHRYNYRPYYNPYSPFHF